MTKTQPIQDTIRAAIRRAERAGMTRYRLSVESGVNQAVLARFYRGERDMTLHTADKLCRVLGLVLVESERRKR